MKNTYISFAASYALISWSKNLRCLAFKPHETDCFKEAKTHHKGFYCLCKLVELKGANKGAYSRPWHAASYALILQVFNPYHFAWLSRFHELNVSFIAWFMSVVFLQNVDNQSNLKEKCILEVLCENIVVETDFFQFPYCYFTHISLYILWQT